MVPAELDLLDYRRRVFALYARVRAEPDPAGRVLAEVVPAERRRYEVASSDGGTMAFDRIGVARFALAGAACELELYWLTAYGGGPFLAFARPTPRGGTHRAGGPPPPTGEGA